MNITRYLLTLPLLAFAADAWQPFALDQHVSMLVPATPQELDLQAMGGPPAPMPAGAHVYMVQTPTEFYQLEGPLVLPADTKLGTSDERKAYFYDVVKGLLMSGPRTTLLRSTPFAIPGAEGVMTTYRTQLAGIPHPIIRYNCCLLAGHTSYILVFFRADGDTTSGAARRRFFNSITVKP